MSSSHLFLDSNYKHHSFKRPDLSKNLSYTVYTDSKCQIILSKISEKYECYLIHKNEKPKLISVDLPKYFKSIPNEKISHALMKHGKQLVKSNEEIVSVRLFPLLLGGGQVSSKVLNSVPSKTKASSGDPEEDGDQRIKELNSQITEVNQVLEEWKKKYRELEESKKKQKCEKIVEIPVEVVKIVEKPVIVELSSDNRINELQSQIDAYEKRILEWRRKFYNFNDTLSLEESTLIEEGSSLMNQSLNKENPEELVIESESDKYKLKQIKEKIRNLQNFSAELQNKCISIETRAKEITTEVEVQIPKYVDRPVEQVTYDNEIVELLKDKVAKLSENVKEWQDRYKDYESNLTSVSLRPSIVSRSIVNETPNTVEYIQEEDDQNIIQMRQELETLRATLKDWQSRLSQSHEDVIEKVIEIPVEVVKYVERPIEIIKTDESKSNELKSQISEIYTSIEQWKQKYQVLKRSKPVIPTYVSEPVNVKNSYQQKEDQRVNQLKSKIADLKNSLEYWENIYKEVSVTEQQVVEKVVEVKVPVTKYVEKPVEVVIQDETKINELKTKIAQMYERLESVKNTHVPKGKKSQRVIEKIVEIPTEVIKYVDRKIEKVIYDHDRIKFLTQQLNDLNQSLFDWENRYAELQQRETKVVEKIVEIPVERFNYVDRVVYVDQVDEAKLTKVTEDYENLRKVINEWQDRYTLLKRKEVRYVDKIVEVPVEVIQYVDTPVDVFVVDQKRLEQLTDEYDNLVLELNTIRRNINEKRARKTKIVEKVVEVPHERIEYIDNEIETVEVDEEALAKLHEEIDSLQSTLEQWQERYEKVQSKEVRVEEKLVEVPIEVFEFIDRPPEIKKPEASKLQALQTEYENILKEIEATKTRSVTSSTEVTKSVQKIVEIPVEKIEYVDKIVEVVKVDEDKVRSLTREYEKLLVDLNNWQEKYRRTESRQQRTIERIIEEPVEVVEYIDNEVIKRKIDERRLRELQREYDRLSITIDNLKDQCSKLQSRQPKVVEKVVERIVEVVEYIDQKVDRIVVDEERLAFLRQEIEELMKKHEDLTSKYQEIEKRTVQVVERKVDVPREVVQYIDYEVEICKIDEDYIRDLTAEIEQINKSLFTWEEKFNQCQRKEIRVNAEFNAVPIEVKEYVNEDVEVLQVDEEAIELLKSEYEKLKNELTQVNLEINAVRREKGHVVEKIVKVPNHVTQVLEREVEIKKVDENKLEGLKLQLERLTLNLNKCNENARLLASKEPIIVDKIIEVPFERNLYKDRETEVVCVDQGRIDALTKRVSELELQLKNLRPPQIRTSKAKTQVVNKYVDEPYEVIREVEIKKEVFTLDQETFNAVTTQYNELVLELADWKKKVIELENREPRIVERVVRVPIERIEYIEKTEEVVKVDQSRIDALNKELESLTKTLDYWKAKTVEIDQTKQRVVERFVDVPKEVIEYVDHEVEVIRVDEERIKRLSDEYEGLFAQLQKVKLEYSLTGVSEPVIVERIVEVPYEVIEYVDKIVEVTVVDEEKLKLLVEEYNSVISQLTNPNVVTEEEEEVEYVEQIKYVDVPFETIKYVDVLQEEIHEDLEKIRYLQDEYNRYTATPGEAKRVHTQYVKLPPVIVEKKVEVPYEVIKYVDVEVQVVKTDEEREKYLQEQINVVKGKINLLQEQYNIINNTPPQVIRKTVEIPVEVVKYIDTFVEVVKYDDSKILNLERGLNGFRSTLLTWLDRYEEPQGNSESVYVKANIPLPQKPIQFDEPNIEDDDDSRLNSISKEIERLNNYLLRISDNFKSIETSEKKVIEKIVEVPVEVIKYVDAPYEVIREDDSRVRELERHIALLQRTIDEHSTTVTKSQEHTKEIIQTVQVPDDKHVSRPKEVHREERNVLALEEQISKIQRSVREWKNKYGQLSQRERKAIEKIVEVPVEVIKYVDRRVETVRADDARIKSLEMELNSLSTQFNDWNNIFAEETDIGTVRSSSTKDRTLETLPSVVRPDDTYLEVQSKLSKFTQEFAYLKQKIEKLDSMERIIVGKIVEVPREIAEYIEQEIPIEDIRPKQFLRELEEMNSRLNAWKQGIQTKTTTTDVQFVEKKINTNENFVDNTPILHRDSSPEHELEEELLEITKLVEELDQKATQINIEKEEITTKFVEIKKEIQKIVFKDVEVLVKDTTQEEFLEDMIRKVKVSIDEIKKKVSSSKGHSVEIFEKIIENKKQIIKEVIRDIELVRWNDGPIKAVEARYKSLQETLENLSKKCHELDQTEYETIEKIVEVPHEVIKIVPRQFEFERFDDRPIISMIEKINGLTNEITAAHHELIELDSLQEEIIEKEILVDVEVVKYELRTKEVFSEDYQPVLDLEVKRDQLLERIAYWKNKVTKLENEDIIIIQKIIEIPVKKLSTVYRSYGEVKYDDSKLRELVNNINEVTNTLKNLTGESSYINNTKVNINEEIIEVPVETVRLVENIITKVKWDDTPVRDLESKIRETIRSIAQIEDKAHTLEIQKSKCIEKVTKIKKEIKKFVIRDVEKVEYDERPIKELEEDTAELVKVLAYWKEKVEILKNEKVPVIENIIEVEKEKVVIQKRRLEVLKYDERPIQKAIEKIDQLHRRIEEAKNRLTKADSRKLRVVEKKVEEFFDVIVYKPRRKEKVVWDSTTVDELESHKSQLLAEVENWKKRISLSESEKIQIINKKIDVPLKIVKKVYTETEHSKLDQTEFLDLQNKINELRNQIVNKYAEKAEYMRNHTEVTEKVIEEYYDVITYEDKVIEVIVYDETPLDDVRREINRITQLTAEVQQSNLDLEKKSNQVIQRIIEKPVEVVKVVERETEKVVWDDTEIYRLEEIIKGLVAKLNVNSPTPSQETEEETQIVERVIKVPREIIKYREKIIEEFIYDDGPIEEVRNQIVNLYNEIKAQKERYNVLVTSRPKVIEKIIEETFEVVKYITNTSTHVTYDDSQVKIIQSKIDAAKNRIEQFKESYNYKKTRREEVIERVIEIEREVVRRVENFKEIFVYDNSRVEELEGKIKDLKLQLSNARDNLRFASRREPNIVEQVVEVKKEVKIYEQRIVEKVYEDDSLLLEWQNKIKSLKTKSRNVSQITKPVKKKRIEYKEKIIEVKKEVVRRVDRPYKVIKYDDTRVREWEKKVSEAKSKYVAPVDEITEIIEEEGDVIEKVVEVPVKVVKNVERKLEKVMWDESNIRKLERELRMLEYQPEDLSTKIAKLAEEKNKVVEEIEEVEVEIIKYEPRIIQVAKVKKGTTEVLDSDLNQLRKKLELVIEQYKNLQNIDRDYIVRTVEVPYETIRPVERRVEVFKVDYKKVTKLEQKLERLRDMEAEIRDQLNEVSTHKSSVVERIKKIPVEKVKYVDRPVKTFKIDDNRLLDLETQLREATMELNQWKKQCEEYDIIKEKVVEVPVEVIHEVPYPVEVIKVQDNLVRELAYQVSTIKSSLAELEARHQILYAQQSEVLEKIVEVPKRVLKTVEREINVVKLDQGVLNGMAQQINVLKNNLAKGKRDFIRYEQKKKIVEKMVEVPEEVIKYIDKPIEVVTFSRKSLQDIEGNFERAFTLLDQWKEKYNQLYQERLTPEERIIEVPVDRKKFGLIRTDLITPDEDDIKRLEEEIQKMTDGILDFQKSIASVRKGLKEVIVREKRVEVPREKIVFVEVPTEVVTIDYASQKELRAELKKLKTAVLLAKR